MRFEVRNISKSYGNLLVLDDITIEFPENETTCILGPSGCGKTTLLNIIAGIIDKDRGEIVGFTENDMSFVFQEDRLIEWKSVKENINFVLKGKMDKAKIEIITDKYLKLVNLEEYKNYYPKRLSGGMRQRISILRAFAYPSKLLIMDEPFKSLDINNKQIVIEFFKELRRKEKRTCILVTHDIEEAVNLADRIVILSDKPSKVNKIIENINENRIEVRKEIEKEILFNGQLRIDN